MPVTYIDTRLAGASAWCPWCVGYCGVRIDSQRMLSCVECGCPLREPTALEQMQQRKAWKDVA